MIPRTFPSTFAANGQQQMVVYSLPSITGLTAWIDYIPVKGVTTESSTLENTYANGGYQVVNSLASLTGKQAWLDYIPVYEDASYTKPWSTDAGGYIPTSALAALLLDFTSGRLDPRITFSRTTNATLTNSAGLVANAPMNLLTFSEQFDNAAWLKAQATITANAAVASDGTTTADLLLPTAITNVHGVSRGVSLSAGTYTISVEAQQQNASKIMLWSGAQGYGFDLSNGTTSAVTGYTAPSAHSITAKGGGIYRCSITVTTAPTEVAYFVLQSFSTANYLGDGVSGIYVWGAQLELGSTATTYNPTTVKNLLGFTEHFDNAAWTKSNASISATKVDDIYGQPFAQKLVENTANASHTIYTQVSNIVTGTPYAVSMYAKAGERSIIRIITVATLSSQAVTVSLVDGSISDGTATVTSVGNGWWRITLAVVATSAGVGEIYIAPRITTGGGSSAYTGDGTSGIYIFGAQLSDSASVDPYVYQPVAAPSSVAYYGPRFDYDPVTLAPKGLLIEEQRSNLLLNSATLSTQVVTVAATAHTLSFYGTGTIVLSGASTGTVVGTGAYPARATLTFTPTVGVLTLTVTGSVTMAQLEAGAFATSYIPTVASQVTRAADVATMVGNNFARWYNQNTGTAFIDYATFASGSITLPVMEFSDGTANNRMLFQNNPAGNSRVLAFVGGSAVVTTLDATAVAQTKVGAAYSVGSWAASYNAAATLTNSYAGVVPGQSQLIIGYTTAGGTPRLNGTISRIAYYPRRLANTELQGITS